MGFKMFDLGKEDGEACYGASRQAAVGRGLLLASYSLLWASRSWLEVATDVRELAAVGQDGLAR